MSVRRTTGTARQRLSTQPSGSHVYMIGSPGGNVVKLGTTTQLAKRLRALQLSSPTPLELLWSAPGDRDSETELHQHFAHLRMHGEWFDFGNGDPVSAVRLAVEAGLGQRPVPADSLCKCGHKFSFHTGSHRACTIVGWDEWLDCQCGRFTTAPPWHTGLPDCARCGHEAAEHMAADEKCTVGGCEEWRDCRCPQYTGPQPAIGTAGAAR